MSKTLEIDSLKKEIQEIKESLALNGKKKTKTKFISFQTRYPKLFDLLIHGTDTTPLDNMLMTLKDYQGNRISEEKAYSRVDACLARKFLYPSLTKQQISQAEMYINESEKR